MSDYICSTCGAKRNSFEELFAHKASCRGLMTPPNPGIAEEIRKALDAIDSGDFSQIAYVHEHAGEWLRWQQGEIERLRAELEQVKAERDKYQKALHEEQRESVRLSEILDRIGNICIEHENAKHQPIGTVRMIQKLAAYAEDHTPTERGDSQ
jgi:hypothetical protein